MLPMRTVGAACFFNWQGAPQRCSFVAGLAYSSPASPAFFALNPRFRMVLLPSLTIYLTTTKVVDELHLSGD
jgi:hypothetical protein